MEGWEGPGSRVARMVPRSDRHSGEEAITAPAAARRPDRAWPDSGPRRSPRTRTFVSGQRPSPGSGALYRRIRAATLRHSPPYLFTDAVVGGPACSPARPGGSETYVPQWTADSLRCCHTCGRNATTRPAMGVQSIHDQRLVCSGPPAHLETVRRVKCDLSIRGMCRPGGHASAPMRSPAHQAPDRPRTIPDACRWATPRSTATSPVEGIRPRTCSAAPGAVRVVGTFPASFVASSVEAR